MPKPIEIATGTVYVQEHGSRCYVVGFLSKENAEKPYWLGYVIPKGEEVTFREDNRSTEGPHNVFIIKPSVSPDEMIALIDSTIKPENQAAFAAEITKAAQQPARRVVIPHLNE